MITQKSNFEAISHSYLKTRKHKESQKKMQTVQIFFSDY